jgi:hypothetical protein
MHFMTPVICRAVLVLLLLSGCRLDAQVEVAVDGDGAGTLAVQLSVDEELRARASDAGADPLATLDEAAGALEGWDVTRSVDAVTLSTGFDDPAELERLTADLATGLTAPEVSPLGPMRVTLTDETVALEGTAGLEVSTAVAELGLTPERAGTRLADGLRYRIVARMPGAVVRTNADERPDDHTVAWTMTPGERRTLQVTADRPWTLTRVVDHLVRSQGVTAIVAGTLLAVAAHRRRRDALALGPRLR